MVLADYTKILMIFSACFTSKVQKCRRHCWLKMRAMGKLMMWDQFLWL